MMRLPNVDRAMPIERLCVRTVALAVVGLALSLTACDNTNKPTATAPPPTSDPVAAEDKAAEAAPDPTGKDAKVKVVDAAPPGEDERYRLEFDTPEATAGSEAKVTVRVVPKDPWHMNLDYPTSLEIAAPTGVALAKASLKKGDAKKLDESACEFDVAFTASDPGDATLTGQFKFAVCQDDACAPVTESVEVKVAVK
jgi:hypothetical protein